MPHVLEYRGRDDARPAVTARGERDERLAHPDLIAKQRSTEFTERRPNSFDCGLLMLAKYDRSEPGGLGVV
jgi:hypothetical protein